MRKKATGTEDLDRYRRSGGDRRGTRTDVSWPRYRVG